jgi:hypothetical protein
MSDSLYRLHYAPVEPVSNATRLGNRTLYRTALWQLPLMCDTSSLGSLFNDQVNGRYTLLTRISIYAERLRRGCCPNPKLRGKSSSIVYRIGW